MKMPNRAPMIMIAVAGAFLVLAGCGKQQPQEAGAAAEPAAAEPMAAPEKLPRLLDLGAKQCVPCKLMEPILAELTEEYRGRMQVEFIDVWENPEAAHKRQVQSIPTQIFYSPDGEELFRHVGFYSKAEILGKWSELGYAFPEASAEP